MPSSDSNAWFDTTSWSLIARAQGDPEELERLVQAYWSPVYAFVRRRGFGTHDASDLTQDFLLHVLLGRGLVLRADADRGRFRTLLKAALRNYIIDDHRRKRADPARNSVAQIPEGQTSDDPDDDPGRAFDQQWAAATLAIALERLQRAREADGLEVPWRAFSANVLGPAIRRTDPIPLDELAVRLGVEDAARVSNMIQTVKRRYRKSLRDVVAETVQDPADVEEELAQMKRHMFQGDA